MVNPGGNNGISVGIKTNVTSTNVYPTDFNDATAQFNLNTSSYTLNAGVVVTTANNYLTSLVSTTSNTGLGLSFSGTGSASGYNFSNTGTVSLKISQFTYNVPASLQSSAAQVAFMVANGNGADVYIDDIEIFSPIPTITLGSNPSACYLINSQTASLPYSATTLNPTTYSIDWNAAANTAGLPDVGSTALPGTPGPGTIVVSIPGALPAAVYSGNLTVTNAATPAKTSVQYPITLTINGLPSIASVPAGATSFYKFSGNGNDTTGANNGTLQNAPTATTDRYGNSTAAYTFNGSNQYVSTATSYTNPSTFTISAWFKTTNNNGVLVGFGNQPDITSGNYDRNLFLHSGKVVFGIYNGGVDTIVSASTYNDGNWHLATATISPANGSQLYVDGILVASNASYNSPQSYTGYWHIGSNNSWVVQYFNGTIDDVTIYNGTELNRSQVSTLYSGTSSNSPICPSSTLSLTETTISGATYLWSGAGSFSPGTSSQNPTVTTPTQSTYSVSVTDGNGCVSTGQTVDSIITTYIWTGATSTDWNVAGNWNCSVPTATSNVLIPVVANKPVLSANVTINNIILTSGMTLGLNGKTFTINGAASGTGTYSGSTTSNMSFGGSATGTVYFTGGSNTIQNLSLSDGANIPIGNALNIASTGTVTVGSVTGATLASGGNMTLLSDDNGSARIAQVPVSSGSSLSTISGSVNVQCYIHSTSSAVSTARRAWRLLTAPITNNGMGTPTTIYNAWQNGGVYTSGVGTMITCPPALVTGSNGMDAGINGNYSMYTWNVGSQILTATGNTKVNISKTNASAANTGYFIFIRGDRNPNTVNLPWFATINNTTLSATGVLQLGDQSFTSASGLIAATAGNLSVVGNPYACSIDFSKVAGDVGGGSPAAYSGLSNIINRMYVWNSNLTGSQNVGGYVCIDDPGYSGFYTKSLGGSGAVSAADLSIQSGQAFFVMTNTTAAASVTFKEATKNATNNFIYRPADTEAANLPGESFTGTLSLLNSDSTTSLTDGIVAQFNDQYCDCVDYIDAPKFSNVDEMFSLARHGKQLCIERRPEIVNTDTLFLNLKQMAQRAYQFGFTTMLPNHPGLGVRLEDNYTGTKTPLNINGSNTVDFLIDANTTSQDTARFKIIFGAVNIVPAYNLLKASREGNTVLVQWSVSNDQQMTGYLIQRSTDGINYTNVYYITAQHTTGQYSWTDDNPVAGTNYYKILSTDILNEESYSNAVSVTINALDPTGIIAYPNPISNGIIGLAFNNIPAGKYQYRILNSVGQEIQTGSINHPGGNATSHVQLDKGATRGSYQVELFGPDQTKETISIIY